MGGCCNALFRYVSTSKITFAPPSILKILLDSKSRGQRKGTSPYQLLSHTPCLWMNVCDFQPLQKSQLFAQQWSAGMVRRRTSLWPKFNGKMYETTSKSLCKPHFASLMQEIALGYHAGCENEENQRRTFIVPPVKGPFSRFFVLPMEKKVHWISSWGRRKGTSPVEGETFAP